MSVLLLLATALALGIRHALDPDHLVAVSTLVAEERRLWPAARLGFIWGTGHMLPIALLGLPILLLRPEVPGAMENLFDLGVGLLLVVLGFFTLWRLARERVHAHAHGHDGEAHLHFHTHPAQATHDHSHTHLLPGQGRRGLITFGIGMLHGLAGTGAAALLALTAAPSVAGGIGYLLAFGLGTVLGMFGTTLCIVAPAFFALSRFKRVHTVTRLLAGLASILVGVVMWVNILPELLT